MTSDNPLQIEKTGTADKRVAASPRSAQPHSIRTDPNQKRLTIGLGMLLVVAIVFGGGGVRYGLSNVLVQLAALALLAFNGPAFWSFWKTAPIALKALIAASLLIPILHVVPMPQDALSRLPGRGQVIQSLGLIGSNAWFPPSVDPARTWVALSGLIVPLAVVALGWKVAREHLVLIGWLIVILGLANLLLGAVQVLSDGRTGLLYPENPMPGVLFGTFANRNSTGLFLVAGLSLTCLLPPPRLVRHFPFVRLSVCILLLTAIVLTRSRTALVLSMLPLVCVMFRWLRDNGRDRRRATKLLAVTVLAGAAAIAALAAWAPGRLADTVERFGVIENDRVLIWEDAAYAADRYWPVGSGMGTFDEVFQVDEALENMGVRRAGRAHNDYIEVTIEAGLPGLLLIAGWLALMAWLCWKARLSPERWPAWAGGAILLAIAAQSVTDYPLRNQAMLAVAGFALVVLARLGATRLARAP